MLEPSYFTEFWELINHLPEMQRNYGETMNLIAFISIPIVVPLGVIYMLWKHTKFFIITLFLLVAGWGLGTLLGSVVCMGLNAITQFFLLPPLSSDHVLYMQNICVIVLTAYLLVDGWYDWVHWKAKH